MLLCLTVTARFFFVTYDDGTQIKRAAIATQATLYIKLERHLCSDRSAEINAVVIKCLFVVVCWSVTRSSIQMKK